MGKHFGNLQKLKGVIYYSLSPVELNPFLKMIDPGLKEIPRRLLNVCGPAVIPVTLSYLLYYWTTDTYAKSKRKNPDDFKDDV